MKLMKFGAKWCPHCKAQNTILDSIEGIDIEKVDVDEAEDLVEEYRIRNIPVTLLLDDNMQELDRITGLATRTAIEEMLDKYECNRYPGYTLEKGT